MMNEGEDDAEDKPPADENAGPKIKMGRIGKKKRTNNAREGATKEGGAVDSGFTKPA